MAKKSKVNPAVKVTGRAMFDAHGRPKPAVYKALDRAVQVQRPLVLANLRRLRAKMPGASAATLNARLERDYLLTVTGTGAAVGATAVVPAIGTITSLGLSAAATAGFLEATALYAQSVAELHGIHLADPERARTMVMAILLGEEGGSLMAALAGQSMGKDATPMRHWGNLLGGKLPTSALKSVGSTIRRRFLRRMVARQGGAMLGRAMPFGIGAVVGGAGNRMMGRAVIRSTRAAFGPVPETIPGELAGELQQ